MDSIVFKVKYEGTLRRFNVAVTSDQCLDLSMEGLRLKIRSLFNLPLDADFRLTYSDEDDDLVTLVEDEDLHDVVKQQLDPVRITVHLDSDKTAQNTTGASGNSTPSQQSASQNVQPIVPDVAEALKSVQQPLMQLLQRRANPDIAEVMQAVKEPLTQALSKLSSEVSSKTTSVSPVLADLFDGLSKLGQSYLNASQSQSDAVDSSTRHENGNNSVPNSEGRSVEASVAEGMKKNDVVGPRPSEPSRKSSQALEGAVPVRPLWSSFSSVKGKHASLEAVMRKAAEKESNKDAAQTSRGSQIGGNMFNPYCAPTAPTECPFSGIPVSGHGQRISYDQVFKRGHSSSRRCNKADGFGSIFHRGVRCDGCGVLPITGPRFKSKVKYDYDLCSICFSRMGNVADYSRIDFPLPYRHPWSLKTPNMIPRLPVMNLPHMGRPHGAKHHRSRLDSRFIMDINVMDGTLMAPSTPFTKIWRMRNNGTLPWSGGLQLLWIGGDRFSPSDSVEIEVPANGVQVGNELDIAVDFIAPELPGRYISYWRMAEPSGHKFGQRVWVLVQVDASVDLTRESTSTLNLNLPPDHDDQAAYANAEFGFLVYDHDTSDLLLEGNLKNEMGDMAFPTNNDLLVPTSVAVPQNPEATSISDLSFVLPPRDMFAPYSVINDDSFLEPTASIPVASVPANNVVVPANNVVGESSGASSNAEGDEFKLDSNNNIEQASEKIGVEENLLKELEHMGFKQIDLNKEVLRMNEYDLERSVDELCGVYEWDPILEELKEMGFEDKETNKKLLAKNNGSITRVVMDLIADEKVE